MLTFLTPHGKIELSGKGIKYKMLCFYLELITKQPSKFNDYDFTINNCVKHLAK